MEESDITFPEKRTRSKGRPVVLTNVPIEFIFAGPLGKHRGVLVRSEGYDLDMIGAAASISEDEDPRSALFSWRSLWSYKRPSIKVIRSYKLRNIDSDNRRAEYSFLWRGFANEAERSEIAQELDLRAVDIGTAIRNRDKDQIEWHLAPILILCDRANKRHNRHRRLMLGIVIFGILIDIILLWDPFRLLG